MIIFAMSFGVLIAFKSSTKVNEISDMTELYKS